MMDSPASIFRTSTTLPLQEQQQQVVFETGAHPLLCDLSRHVEGNYDDCLHQSKLHGPQEQQQEQQQQPRQQRTSMKPQNPRQEQSSTVSITQQRRRYRQSHYRCLSVEPISSSSSGAAAVARWTILGALTIAVSHGFSNGVVGKFSPPTVLLPPRTIVTNTDYTQSHHRASSTTTSSLLSLESEPLLAKTDLLEQEFESSAATFDLGPQFLSCPPLDLLTRINSTWTLSSPSSSFFFTPTTMSSSSWKQQVSMLSMTASSLSPAALQMTLPTTMFLNPPRRISTTGVPPSSSTTTHHPSTFYRQQQEQQLEESENYHRHRTSHQRGILGFDVSSSSSSASSSSALSSTRPRRRSSNVNLNKWNDPTTTLFGGDDGIDAHSLRWDSQPTPLSLSSASRGSSFFFPASRSTGAAASTTTEGRQAVPLEQVDGGSGSGGGTTTGTEGVLPAWFPYIPSKAQIETLKVAELKEACVHRGLKKSGNKTELQQRLWHWTVERQEAHQARLTEDRRWSIGGGNAADAPPTGGAGSATKDSATKETTTTSSAAAAPNSLAEWARTVDLQPLLNKREKIHREKRQGHHQSNRYNRNKRRNTNHATPTKEYLSALAVSIQSPSSPYSSNIEAKELYEASKQADQLGEREIAQQLLETLLEVTPNDARVYRRLARMASEEGNVGKARQILQRGIRRFPDNGFLWHGLGQLELKEGVGAGGTTDNLQARRYFAKAIQVDPTLPHPYHALGTLEHTHGRIAAAMKVLKRGIEYCPTNHRLHHALGDLYRGAKLLTDAERSYRRALEHAPSVSHCFAYSALAYVAYEKEDLVACRHWLRKSVGLNKGRHAQGWLSWAQLEESEGDIDKARSVCIAAISQYERGLIAQRQYYKQKFQNNNYHKQQQQQQPRSASEDKVHRQWKSSGLEGGGSSDNNNNSKDMSNPLELKNQLLRSVPTYRSGDRFLKVYRNWARLEERYGTFESVDEVYGRACVAFPTEYRLLIDWASYHYGMRNVDRARSLFRDACAKVGNRHSSPYRLYAEFEMSHGNFVEAKSILFRGAQVMSQSSDGALGGNRRGLAELFHTWAVCEWRLGNMGRAEVLFDHALRVTEAGDEGSPLRSFILHSIARLEYHRGEHHLAQHCIGLCLKENLMPGGNYQVWELWADVASDMGNDNLARDCLVEAEKARCDELMDDSHDGSVARLMKGLDMQHLMRQDPWYHKLFGNSQPSSSANFFVSTVKLPAIDEEDDDDYDDLGKSSFASTSSFNKIM